MPLSFAACTDPFVIHVARRHAPAAAGGHRRGHSSHVSLSQTTATRYGTTSVTARVPRATSVRRRGCR